MSTTSDPSFHESRAGVPIAVVSVCLTIATIAVCLRTYARAVLIRQFGMDDWAAIVALVLAVGSGVMVATNTIYGAGRHIAVVDKTVLWKYFRTFWISIVLYNGSLTATKVTFLLQYYRVLGTKRMKNIILMALVFILMWSISQLLVVIFTCVPVQRFWLPETPGTCVSTLPFWYANAAGNIVTDAMIFILPLPALGGLKLRKPQKVMLIGVFCLGFFTCAISVIRIQYLRLSDDVTWDNVSSSCWSIAELCSGITCACLPTLRPLLSMVLPSMRTQGTKDSAGYKQHGSGRDGTGEGRSWSKGAELSSASSRAIVYPEDVELQPTESEERAEEHRIGGLTHARHDRHIPEMPKLGLNSTVQTEIRVGTPNYAQGGWSRSEMDGRNVSRGIVVQHEIETL
ncbi:hypothetical protein B0H66DRAFT_542599 [Apodospora peruviana]|uniref:Rhodopsin domain-containing protein n=1 Tax=Apodospora peruviana TaxID=516989 RepID=A0AAE0IS50_9PEZI|nr:hypothetical protein B0H66DRAFT_542599 [Apodospora peruviana]